MTARRYLEYLADVGVAIRSLRYVGGGRPEVQYTWKRTQSTQTAQGTGRRASLLLGEHLLPLAAHHRHGRDEEGSSS